MNTYRNKLFGLVLICTFFLLLPSAIALTDYYEMPSAYASHSHIIESDFHNGRIAFTFMANVSLTVSIAYRFANDTWATPLWSVTSTNGSTDLTVDPGLNYYYRFIKSPGYAVRIDFTLEGNPSGIPGFIPLYILIGMISILAIVYLKRLEYL